MGHVGERTTPPWGKHGGGVCVFKSQPCPSWVSSGQTRKMHRLARRVMGSLLTHWETRNSPHQQLNQKNYHNVRPEHGCIMSGMKVSSWSPRILRSPAGQAGYSHLMALRGIPLGMLYNLDFLTPLFRQGDLSGLLIKLFCSFS